MSTRTNTKLVQLALALVVITSSGAAQQADAPELTLDDAIAQAIANNSSLKTAGLDTVQEADDLRAARTKRLASTQVTALGGQLLTRPSFTFQKGALGTYPSTGPIPSTNTTTEIARKPAGAVYATVAQPLSTQYRIHLQLRAMDFGLKATRQEEQKTRLEVVDEVRRAYYSVVQAQSSLDSLEASLPFYEESQRLAGENLKHETVLESDLLGSKAQLLKTRNSVSDAEDKVATACEKLNDLMGRDIHTQFRVASVEGPDNELETAEELEAESLHNRPELKKARLQVLQADYDARAKKAEYIPDMSAAFSYFTTANLQNALPSNIAVAGMQINWEPWDWWRKRDEYEAKRAKEEQAKVAVDQTQRTILIETRTALRTLESARRQLELTDATQRTARQRLKEVQAQVKREAVLTRVLFQAQSDLASADSQQQQALAAFWKARADLKKAIGEE